MHGPYRSEGFKERFRWTERSGEGHHFFNSRLSERTLQGRRYEGRGHSSTAIEGINRQIAEKQCTIPLIFGHDRADDKALRFCRQKKAVLFAVLKSKKPFRRRRIIPFIPNNFLFKSGVPYFVDVR